MIKLKTTNVYVCVCIITIRQNILKELSFKGKNTLQFFCQSWNCPPEGSQVACLCRKPAMHEAALHFGPFCTKNCCHSAHRSATERSVTSISVTSYMGVSGRLYISLACSVQWRVNCSLNMLNINLIHRHCSSHLAKSIRISLSVDCFLCLPCKMIIVNYIF